MQNTHPFHLVDASPWPFLVSWGALFLTTGLASWMHGFSLGAPLQIIGLFLILMTTIGWFRDITREGTFNGDHTKYVQKSIKIGFLLFLATEIVLFFSFFFAYFHVALAPSVEIGGVWPPVGIEVFNPLEIPLVNTIILVTSGATVTWAHHAIVVGDRRSTIIGLLITVLLGGIFTAFQALEYLEASFTIADSVWGSTFFMLTGLHGAHVCAGSLFLLVALIRVIKHHLATDHHLGLESAIIYWHMVDVVWLILYVVVYCWSWI